MKLKVVELFHGASHACLCRVCSALHLTALPPMSSTFVGMSGYNVQAMRFLRSDCLPALRLFPRWQSQINKHQFSCKEKILHLSIFLVKNFCPPVKVTG